MVIIIMGTLYKGVTRKTTIRGHEYMMEKNGSQNSLPIQISFLLCIQSSLKDIQHGW